jgi:hypothetical protein
MSRCLNKATLIGYLGADPEIRTTPGGARVAQFSLGTTRRWNDRNGRPQEKTQWHRVVVWDSLPATFGLWKRWTSPWRRHTSRCALSFRPEQLTSDRDRVVRFPTCDARPSAVRVRAN